MADFKYNRVLLAMMLVGLIAALMINWQRHTVEENSSRVELVMDYEDIMELAHTEGESAESLFQQFKEAGITTLAVYDTTLEKLHKDGKLTVLAGVDVLEKNKGLQKTVSPAKVYIFANPVATADDTYTEVKSDLIRRLGAERVREIPDANYRVLEVDGNYEKLIKWNLGLSRQEIREAAGKGFFVMLRPTNFTKVEPDDVHSVFERSAGIDNVSGLMFVGDEVLGYPDLLPLTADSMKKRDMTLGLIEHPLQLQFLRQEGLTQLAVLLNYQAARVYVIPKDEQPKLKINEAIQRWVVTDQERNIRINLLRKYDKAEGNRTVIETNLDYVTGIKEGLLEKGFVLGKASTFPAYFPSPLLLALVILAATAAGVLYLTQVFPFPARYQYILLACLGAVLVFPVLKGSGTLVRQMAALASAILVPALAMTWQLDRWRKRQTTGPVSLGRIVLDGAVSLTLTLLLSLVGGMYVASLLGDVRFLLEMEIFRGVKATFILPLVLITLTYLTRFPLVGPPIRSTRDIWSQTIQFLNYPVQIKTLLAAGVAAVVAWGFIGRSGHTAGVPVPAIELKLRAFLEHTMYARPREKEFLIGHPAFMVAVMAVYQRWPQGLHYVLVLLATIAQGSLVETFAHLRTPVFMSFVRALDGLAVGVIFGALAVIGLWLLQYLSGAVGRRPSAHE
ncbi:DUF5693 family protein [Anaerospora hongkongensis]|uniref:DUF5693 family protein n=1 Tax=Anaerospora hongkongensis TaxID=244830 RepID=UPI00289F5BBC|nr:DUF5693 family protein [Anaerospora hongkongensis]